MSPLLAKNIDDLLTQTQKNIDDLLMRTQKVDDPPYLKVLKDFLKRILESPEVMDDPYFFKNGIPNDIFVETCEQSEGKKASDKKKQKAVSVVVVVNKFLKDINPKD
jgi:hypothetical protein